jgi:steroid delta-isomerase-like uncharacterized protein
VGPAAGDWALKVYLKSQLKGGKEMSIEENKKVYLRFLYEIWSEGKLDVADEIYADDYVYKESSFQKAEPGVEAFKKRVMEFRNSFPDLSFTHKLLIGEGDWVVCYWRGTGTHTGTEFMGIAPKGNRIDVKGIDILKIVNGKIVEGYDSPDYLSFMKQVNA